MSKFSLSTLTALTILAAFAAPAAAQWTATTDPAGMVHVHVPAQPGDLVVLLLGPSLAPPTALPGFTGLLALDPATMVAIPGAPVGSDGISHTVLSGAVSGMWLAPWLQPAIRSPRDPASGEATGLLHTPRQLRQP